MKVIVEATATLTAVVPADTVVEVTSTATLAEADTPTAVDMVEAVVMVVEQVVTACLT